MNDYEQKTNAALQQLQKRLQQRFDAAEQVQTTIVNRPLSEYFLYLEQAHATAKFYIPLVAPTILYIQRPDSFAEERYLQDMQRQCIEMLAGAFLIFRSFRGKTEPLDASIAAFGAKMVEVLEDNAYKRGWEGFSTAWFWLRMEDELAELRAVVVAYEAGDPIGWKPVEKEATDVANFAMMTMDNLGLLA